MIPPLNANLKPVDNVPAVLPVDPNKNAAVNATSVNRTNLGTTYNLLSTEQKFDKLFPLG
jgi:hypothetical protein